MVQSQLHGIYIQAVSYITLALGYINRYERSYRFIAQLSDCSFAPRPRIEVEFLVIFAMRSNICPRGNVVQQIASHARYCPLLRIDEFVRACQQALNITFLLNHY